MSDPASALGHAFSLDEDPAATAQRLLADQLDGALGVLESFARDRGRAIHEFRKHGKRLRAILRLLRPGWSARVYGAWNETLRHAASRFSEARDGYVWEETLEFLRGHAGEGDCDWEATRDWLRERRQREWPDERLDRRAVEVENDVKKLLIRLEQDDFTKIAWKDLIHAVGRGYRRGEREFVMARETRDPAHFHEWRKRTKYGAVQFALVRELAPDDLDRRSREAARLGSLLGRHHDIAVLEELLRQSPEKEMFHPLLVSAEEVRAGLDAEALALGELLYDEDPSAFVNRLKRAWRDRSTPVG